jgi:hypothetical protein
MTVAPEMAANNPGPEGLGCQALRPWLQWLDDRIRLALAAGGSAHGPQFAADPYRGLVITPAEVEWLLLQEPGQPLFGDLGSAVHPEGLALPVPFLRLVRVAKLSKEDIAFLLLAIAPEVDLRYERLYAYLQDDVNRKRPTVDLALNLLSDDADGKVALRTRFLLPAPLVRFGLLQLDSEGGSHRGPLLARSLRPAPQVVAALLGGEGLDEAVHHACEVVYPAGKLGTGDEALTQRLIRMICPAVVGSTRVLHLQGADPLARAATAERVAEALGRPLLRVRLPRLLHPEADFGARLGAGLREAWLREAVVSFEDVDTLREEGGTPALRVLLAHLAEARTVVLLGGAAPWDVPGDAAAIDPVVSVSLPPLTSAERHALWRHELQGHGLDPALAARLADRLPLESGQIRGAVRLVAGQSESPGEAELLAAARQQTRRGVCHLVQPISPVRSWEDLVLPEDGVAQLRAICACHAQREQVLQRWGFGRKLAYGTGTHVLFTGPSGTGKTMAAEIMAGELGLDLLRIDLARVVSKYIGETEKNLETVFAEGARGILFFDEADALFGKRSEVKDAHDRYANLEVSYLLQKMEQHEGVSILASNLRHHLDEAFLRRLTFIVPFPFPDAAHRRRIWEGVWPKEVPLAPDVDLEDLAESYKLSGGGIRNVALAAAYLAAEEGVPIARAHLLRAMQREMEKEGKMLKGPDGESP